MDVSKYRKEYIKTLQQEAKKQARQDAQLANARTPAAKRRAMENSSALRLTSQVDDARTILANKSEQVDLRIAALKALDLPTTKSESLVDLALRVLVDGTEPVTLRREASNALRLGAFTGAVGLSKRPEYLAALRSIVDETDAALRHQAIEILAQEGDEYVQQRLLKGLSDPQQALVAPATALALLSYDIHTSYYPVLRQVIANPPNRAAKVQAVRMLAADPSSQVLLTDILSDKKENAQVRRMSALALQTLAPNVFETHAKKIVRNNKEDRALRASVLNALGHSTPTGGLQQDEQFNRQVERLSTQSPSRAIKSAARQYIARTKE